MAGSIPWYHSVLGASPFSAFSLRVCQVLCFLPTRTSWQKIANSKLLHTLTMEFVNFVLSGSELAIFCQLVRVGNFLPTRCQQTWQTRQKLGRNSVEFVPNLADTPRTWQKKKELGRKGSELGRSSFRQNRTTSVPSEVHRQMT